IAGPGQGPTLEAGDAEQTHTQTSAVPDSPIGSCSLRRAARRQCLRPLYGWRTSMATKGPVVAIEKITPAYWRATFQNPPINLLDPEVYASLRLLLDRIETNDDLRVVVFDSADPDYFISHLDVARLPEVPDIPGAADLATDWPNFVTRL